ncbi:MAG: YajD family HNH nuclease [Candidatus Polarisedimenticolaceae bacterium]|nr:YajD family HNH nuclease [Candidatus Polarisedimenticolaceae bacterium]
MSKDRSKLDQIVIDARRAAEERSLSYREQSLRLHPWICGRCAREFTRANLHELTVHHKDHNHDNNPPDGSNWENLCLYCHDNEHQRYVNHLRGYGGSVKTEQKVTTSNPFASLADMLKQSKSDE